MTLIKNGGFEVKMSKEEIHKLAHGDLSKKEAEILVHGKGN